MKSKTKVLISLTLLIIFLFSSIFNSRFSKNIVTNKQSLEFNDKNQIQIKQSGFWNLTGNPIYIDDLATGVGAHNWTWAETQPWCSGSGNWIDPYVIENVTIDGQGSGNCISIENSDAYFIIRNCTVYNSVYASTRAGIKLNNVDNGKIINNNCSGNKGNGIHLYYSDNNTISGNNASNNNYYGIYFQCSDNSTISGNNANNNERGIYVYFSDNSTISGNNANNNEHGMILSDSDNSTISGNNASNNNYYGIYLPYSNNNTLSGNLMNFCGISLYGSLAEMASHSIDDTNRVDNKPVYYYVNETGLGSSNFTDAGQIILINCNNSIISGLNLSNGTTGIYLYYCVNNTISENTISNNNYYGIYLIISNNNTISRNNANNNERGIYISYSNNNTISGNNANNNDQDGIRLRYSDNNALSGNTANYNHLGLSLDNSDNNTISGNNASNNNYYGINLMESNNNTISGNNASNNTNSGIYLSYNNNNTISENTVNNNSYGIHLLRSDSNRISGNNASNNNILGIYLYDCVNNTLSGNNASNNNYYGIYLMESNNNTISGNAISNNSNGINIDSYSNNNKIFLNHFINNDLNAEDNGINNTWDDGFTGNYWDDYAGVDANDDGIGDTPYIIPGTAVSQDNFPIWTDGDDLAPVITIIFPLPNDVFGLVAPNYNISIDELNLDTIWYTLDGGTTNYTITGLTGTFNQLTWGALSEGSVTIRFYANDTVGHIGSTAITVEKDISAPVITIIFPLSESLFGLVAPNYNISIEELNLDTIWYTLDGGITNYTITDLTGTFNHLAWEALSEGSLTIRFYANDTAGNIGFIDVEVIIEIPEDLPIISFGNYYILFMFITILSFIVLEKRKKK